MIIPDPESENAFDAGNSKMNRFSTPRCRYAAIHSAALRIILAFLIVAAIVSASTAIAADEIPAVKDERSSDNKLTFPEPSPSSDAYYLDTGDHLSVRFYDRYDRDDLNGEYVIGESGRLRLPRIGIFFARKKTPVQLEHEIRGAVEGRGEKLGYFSLDVSRCRPFYVVGPVNRPGAYAYIPGLIVVQAVALAGGLRPSAHVAEAIREKRTLTEITSRISNLIARRARLEAERQGLKTIPLPKELVQWNPRRARDIIASEQNMLKSAREVAESEKSSLTTLIVLNQQEADNYKSELARLGQRIEEQTRLFSQLKKLHEDKIINQARFLEAVTALDGLRRDKQFISIGLAASGIALEKAQRDLALHDLSKRAQLAKEINEVELELEGLKQTAADTRELSADLAIGEPSAQLTSYKIMRPDEAGRVNAIQADETAAIRPGDIIEIQVRAAVDPLSTD